jgi:hypothetical protein
LAAGNLMKFPIEFDVTELAAAQFEIGSVTGWLDARHIQIVRLDPGTYSIQSPTGHDASWNFAVDANGKIAYEPALGVDQGGFLDGNGTSRLVVAGFALTVDATSVTGDAIALYNFTGWLDPKVTHPLRLLPGEYQFQHALGLLPEGTFTVGIDGTVTPNAASIAFLKAKNGALQLSGIALTLDATAVTGSAIALYNITGWLDPKLTHPLRLLPGEYQFQHALGLVPEGTFTVGADGTVTPNAASIAFLKVSNGTLQLAGFALTLDATAVTGSAIAVYNVSGWLDPKVTHPLRLLPGQYQFQHALGLVPECTFAIDSDGAVRVTEMASRFLRGIDDKTLLLTGIPIYIDASEYRGVALILNPYAKSIDTGGAQPPIVFLLPQIGLSLEVQTEPPTLAIFDLAPSGGVRLAEPYPHVEIGQIDGQILLRFVRETLRQKRPCCYPKVLFDPLPEPR